VNEFNNVPSIRPLYSTFPLFLDKKVDSIAEKVFKNGWMERIMEQYLKNRR